MKEVSEMNTTALISRSREKSLKASELVILPTSVPSYFTELFWLRVILAGIQADPLS
jgi:hypothetical protein